MDKLNMISLDQEFMEVLENDPSFKYDNNKDQSLSIDTHSHANLRVKPFNIDDYVEVS